MTATSIYVANSGSDFISHLALEDDGTLRPVASIRTGAPASPLASSRDKRFLYAMLRGDFPAMASYAVAPDTGEPSLLAVTPAPATFAYMACDRDGKFLLGASYNDGVVCSLPIDGDGCVGGEPVTLLRPGRNPHCVLADHDNRFAFAPVLGDDLVEQYRLEDGRLVPHPLGPIRTPPGSGPRHLVFSPDNRHAYLLTELSGVVILYWLDGENGILDEIQTISVMPPGSALPPGAYTPPLNREGGGNSPHPVIWAADIHITPDGRFLYASERTTGILTCCKIDADSGRLTYAFSIATEAQPRGFAIDPSGRYLVAAGEKSGAVSSYAICRKSGALQAVDRAVVGEKPNWVEIVRRG